MQNTAELVAAVPDLPAPPIPTYPQFAETEVPLGSGASRAYRGFIRPFSDDATACRVLRGIEANETLLVSAGRLDFDASNLPRHPLEPYLIGMAEPCTVVVLEFPGTVHHRAYLANPPVIARFTTCQHMWRDLALTIDGRITPALCVYSGNLFRYDDSCERLPQFLNQLSTYLAKYLIFLRTRMLYTIQKNGPPKRHRVRLPVEPINFGVLSLSKKFIWIGIWVGPAAPSGPAAHLMTVKPNDECWCNRGKTYEDCCMPRERRQVDEMRRQHTQRIV